MDIEANTSLECIFEEFIYPGSCSQNDSPAVCSEQRSCSASTSVLESGIAESEEELVASHQFDNVDQQTTESLTQSSRICVPSPAGRVVDYKINIPQYLSLGSNIQMLGEIVVDMNIFNQVDGLNNSSRYEFSSDLPWNIFRPAVKVKQFPNGSLLSFHDTVMGGRLNFTDIVQVLYNAPNQKVHKVALKLGKYQQKIQIITSALNLLRQHYSDRDLEVIFSEVQTQSVDKAMQILEIYETDSIQMMHLYTVNTTHPGNLLSTMFAVGQSNELVNLLSGGNEVYKLQLLRKGFLNFCSSSSHFQMLLMQVGEADSGLIECRTIEGFIIQLHVRLLKYTLKSIKLNPVEMSFHSVLTIYELSVGEDTLEFIRDHRLKNKFNGLPDDFSYMLDCQIFLAKHYENQFDLSTERRCHFRARKSDDPKILCQPTAKYVSKTERG